MALPRNPEPATEVNLSRTGGGKTKWLIAAGALVVLGGFVYLGVSGRSATPISSPTPNPVVAVIAATPRPTATAYPNDEVVSIRADPTAPVLYQYLGTGLTINGRGILAILDPVGANAYRGIYRIPLSQAAPTARLEFDAVTASVSTDATDRLGDWTFPTNSIARGSGPPVIVLDQQVPASDQTLAIPDFSRVAANGYRITVTTQNEGDAALMTVDVLVNPDQNFPSSNYTLTVGEAPDVAILNFESTGNGWYDGEVEVPDALIGTKVRVQVTASTDSDLPVAPNVGSWFIRASRRPRQDGLDRIEVHTDGQAIADGDPLILETGYDLYLWQDVADGRVMLRASLHVRPLPPAGAPLPVPTTR